MILLDYSGIAMAGLFAAGTDKINEQFVRHLILNSIRMYNVKYRKEYGQMVLCCDGGSNWRRDIFPEYKQKRRDARNAVVDPDAIPEKDPVDWDEFFRVLNLVRDEIASNLPIKVLRVEGTEADDIIGTIVRSTQEFGSHDEIMIVSSDHDFIQLQTFGNVSQFSPATKKIIRETPKNVERYAFEQILRGCGGDGVPNILSPDKVFITEGARQTPLSSKKIDALWEAKQSGNLDKALADMGVAATYARNYAMIDLVNASAMPEHFNKLILEALQVPTVHPSKALNYLVKNRCSMLIPSVSDFFPSKN